jgi:hypothetical protein
MHFISIYILIAEHQKKKKIIKLLIQINNIKHKSQIKTHYNVPLAQ